MRTIYFKSSLLEIPSALEIFSKVERVGFIRPFSILLIYALSTLKAFARSTCDMFFFKRNFRKFCPSFIPDDINRVYCKLHQITTCSIIHIEHVRPEFRQKKTSRYAFDPTIFADVSCCVCIVPNSHLFPKQSEVMTSHARSVW